MSVQELLTTHDCSVPGCPDEARERGGMCRYHQADRAPVAAACKVDGCTNPSAGKGGWCAGLCDEHVSVEGRRRQAVRFAKVKTSSEEVNQDPLRQPRASTPKKGHSKGTPAAPKPRQPAAAAAREHPEEGTLVALATECEAARAALAEARLRHVAAVDALRAALDAAA